MTLRKHQKRWPTHDELLAWFLHKRNDMGTLRNPSEIAEALQTFKDAPPEHWHRVLYADFPDFKKIYYTLEEN